MGGVRSEEGVVYVVMGRGHYSIIMALFHCMVQHGFSWVQYLAEMGNRVSDSGHASHFYRLQTRSEMTPDLTREYF